nr:hypothetical protein [Kibdelosporangium sp. MJ126-NF4]CTQ94067.1 hypothetical protein [Kibdelosporangium sp. MJ126-NF4]
MVAWRSNDEIERAAQHLQATFVWLKDDEWPSSGYPRAHVDAVDRDWRIVLSLDPRKLADEYERMHKAAAAVGTNGPLDADFDQTLWHLGAWTGAAADEFKRQVSMMKTFCDDHQLRMLRGVQCVAAAYALATEVRDSYLKLIVATEAAARNAKEESDKEDTKLVWASLANLVSGILSANPASMLTSTLETAVQIGKDVSQRMIEGDDSDQVMDSYRREADGLFQQFGMTLDGLTTEFNGQRVSAEEPTDLYEPLSPQCDVRSPDFRYERFANTVHNPGPVGSVVEEERQKYVVERKAEGSRVSEIEKRLNRGGRAWHDTAWASMSGVVRRRDGSCDGVFQRWETGSSSCHDTRAAVTAKFGPSESASPDSGRRCEYVPGQALRPVHRRPGKVTRICQDTGSLCRR